MCRPKAGATVGVCVWSKDGGEELAAVKLETKRLDESCPISVPTSLVVTLGEGASFPRGASLIVFSLLRRLDAWPTVHGNLDFSLPNAVVSVSTHARAGEPAWMGKLTCDR